jgi:hypothetical protein
MATKHLFMFEILVISSLGAILFGCTQAEDTPSPDQMDKSPFTGIPCAAPCWQGLTIAESGKRDVMAALPNLTFIDQDTIDVYQVLSMPGIDPTVWAPGTEITANCVRPEKQCVRLRVVDGVLSEINVWLNYEIRADEAIVYLGEPDYVGYGELGAERVICEVYFVWRNEQLVLASQQFEGPRAVEKNCGVVRETGKVESSLVISEARYMSQKGIEFMLSRAYNISFDFSGTIPEK